MKYAILGEMNLEWVKYLEHQERLTDEEEKNADFFICSDSLVGFDKSGNQDVSLLKAELKRFSHIKDKPFFIFSTTIPKTVDHLKKFYKMRLYSMPYCGNEKSFPFCAGDLKPGETASDNSALTQRNFIATAFTFDNLPEITTNRRSETTSFFKIISFLITTHTHNLFARYSKTAGISCDMVEKTFAGRPSAIILSLILEWKRLGLQTAFLESLLTENSILRLYPKEDLPSLAVVLSEKTREKLMTKKVSTLVK